VTSMKMVTLRFMVGGRASVLRCSLLFAGDARW
jgi:hypothetical protein